MTQAVSPIASLAPGAQEAQTAAPLAGQADPDERLRLVLETRRADRELAGMPSQGGWLKRVLG